MFIPPKREEKRWLDVLRPSDVFTLDEINSIAQIFSRHLGVSPRIIHFGSHLIFARAGRRLFLHFTLSPQGQYELEVKNFELPAKLRGQGMGSSFFQELMEQEYMHDRFAVIRLIPLTKSARRFWQKVGFAESGNYLFMHYQFKSTPLRK